MNRLVLFGLWILSTYCLIAQPIPVGNARILMVENETISLKMGETCVVTLDEKNKGQQAWTAFFSQNNVLYKKSETFHEEKRTFVFAVANPGEVTVTMTLTNRQTGAVAKTAPKTYKVTAFSPKTKPIMAAVTPQATAAKPVSMSKPVASSAAVTQAAIAPVYANMPVNAPLQPKSENPTNTGFYATTTPTPTSSQNHTRGAAKPQQNAGGAAPTTTASQNATAVAVSNFHTEMRNLTVFEKNIVNENEVFGVDIEENIPTGKWIYVLDKSSIQLVDEQVFEKVSGLSNKNKLHAYKFKATQAGVYDILFHVFSTENHSIDKYITYTIEVK